MNKIIITINRECGSRGGRIAHLLGENLGLKVYDRLMLDSIAEKFDMTVEHIERVKAQKTNWWSDFCRFYQQFGAVSYSPGNKFGNHKRENYILQEEQYYLQILLQH